MIDPNLDRFTEAERLAWDTLALAAGRILSLGAVHPAERDEAALHIHGLQTSLLARAAYEGREE